MYAVFSVVAGTVVGFVSAALGAPLHIALGITALTIGVILLFNND